MIGREELERKAFRLIKEAGDGLLQSEMRKILGVGSSEASSIALKFLERGVIKRLKELHDGRWTYRLISLRKHVTLDSIKDCPCLACDETDRCIPGRFTSPLLCPILTEWMNLKESEKTRETPHTHLTSIQ